MLTDAALRPDADLPAAAALAAGADFPGAVKAKTYSVSFDSPVTKRHSPPRPTSIRLDYIHMERQYRLPVLLVSWPHP